jgi:hypothetical protein
MEETESRIKRGGFRIPIFNVVVVRHVPATICEQCGAEWIDDNNAEQLDQIVNSKFNYQLCW